MKPQSYVRTHTDVRRWVLVFLLDWVDDGRIVSHAGQHVDKSKTMFECRPVERGNLVGVEIRIKKRV